MAFVTRRRTWILVLVCSHLLLLLVGSGLGRYLTFQSFTRQAEKADMEVNIGRYITYRDLASSLKAGNYNSAKCSADLIASSFFDDVKRCAAHKDCWGSLRGDQVERIPEVTGLAPVPFDYINAANGVRRCR